MLPTNPVGHEPTPPVAVREGRVRCPGTWTLHHRGQLTDAEIAWRLCGPPDAPLVAALGGIWCDRRLFDPDRPRQGCWAELVGPARALDPARVRILSFDYLGGSGDSSGPKSGAAFPSISAYDQADALARVLDALREPALRAIVGSSYSRAQAG